MAKFFFIMGAAFLYFFSSCSPSRAAVISIEKSIECSIALRGKIEAGDFNVLESKARQQGLLKVIAGDEIPNTPDRALCLDSIGGSYLEGRKISGLIHKFGITTRVQAGASCYSACAFIFMAGRVYGLEADAPSRYLNVDGHLGFHAPYFDVDDKKILSGKELELMSEFMNKIVGEFVKFGSYKSTFDVKPMFSLSLLGNILSMGPNEMFLIETVESAARWGISLDGIRNSSEVGLMEAVQTCVNFQSWIADESSMGGNFEYFASRLPDIEPRNIWNEEMLMTKIDMSGLAENYCLVQISKTAIEGIAICSIDDFKSQSFGDCNRGYAIWVPWYYSLHPDTKLRELKKNKQ